MLNMVSLAPFTPGDFFRAYENTLRIYQVPIWDVPAAKDANTQHFLTFGQIKVSVLCKQRPGSHQYSTNIPKYLLIL